MNPRSTKFSDLSTEILLDIFDYLDLVDLFRAFANVNEHFRSLITDRHIALQANFLSMTEEQLSWCEKVLLPQFAPSIRYLTISNEYNFIHRTLSSVSFNSLQSIRLYDVHLQPLWTILRSSQLKSIFIETDHIKNEKHLQDLFHHLFTEQKELRSIECRFHTNLHFIEEKNKTSRLRRLILHDPCLSSDVIVLISQLPELKHLTANIDDYNRHMMDRDVDHLPINESIRSATLSIIFVPYERLTYLLSFIKNLDRFELHCPLPFHFFHADSLEENYRYFRCRTLDD